MFKKIIPLALIAMSQGLSAQQLPGAGSQIQQIPPSPTPQQALPAIGIAPASAPAGAAPDTARITVNRLRVTGSQIYTEAELLALTGFRPGSELTLGELRAMASAITERYRNNGYFVAQAYLPAQTIQDGEVAIAVSEGRYGQVTVRNQSTLSDALIASQLEGLNAGDAVAIGPLESRLLLLSDIPGVKISSTLAPGASAGASDLIVDVVPGPRVSGSVDADNAGNRYTGEYRLGATLNLNNAAGRGDVASLRLLTAGSGLNYARASYQMQFGKATAGVAYSWLGYELGREFAYAQATGSARIASVYGSYPLLRSRASNIHAGLAFDAKTFRDERPLNPATPVEDRKAQVLTASLRGDNRDGFGRGGVTAWSMAASTGNIDIETPSVRALDAASARSNGGFGKLAVSVLRLQIVTERVSLYAGLNAQKASKNLDSSEKMELGGLYGVRAYPAGEAYGDQGYVLNLEARLRLPVPERFPGELQLSGFADAGMVTVNKNPWSAGSNRRTLSGAGVGLNWSVAGDFMVRTFYARKLGDEAATSAPDRSGRFWIQAVKYF